MGQHRHASETPFHWNDVSLEGRWWPAFSGIWILTPLTHQLEEQCQAWTPSEKNFLNPRMVVLNLKICSKSLCHLLTLVNETLEYHAPVANICFTVIRENKFLAKILNYSNLHSRWLIFLPNHSSYYRISYAPNFGKVEGTYCFGLVRPYSRMDPCLVL